MKEKYSNMWLLIWFTFIPDQGIKYYHIDTFRAETLCKVAQGKAVVLAREKTESLECIFVSDKK